MTDKSRVLLVDDETDLVIGTLLIAQVVLIPVVVHLARELSAMRSDGLGPYLEARQLLGQRRYALALPLLREAAQRGLPSVRLERELFGPVDLVRRGVDQGHVRGVGHDALVEQRVVGQGPRGAQPDRVGRRSASRSGGVPRHDMRGGSGTSVCAS